MNLHNFNLHDLGEDGYYSNSFGLNLIYSILYHSTGITKPNVWLGTFSKFELSQYQKLLFDVLRNDEGFKRTPFQLIFPEQNAGLIKRLSYDDKQTYTLDENIDEAHIRFYLDGSISCELEPNRYNTIHYNYSMDGTDYLVDIINQNSSLTSDDKENLISQVEFKETKEVRDLYTASDENPLFQEFARDIRTCNLVTDCWILGVVKNVTWAGASVAAYVFYDKMFSLLYENTNFFEMLVK
jgi:hypothetical protein